MPTGKLFFVLRTASGALPVNNAEITVTDSLGATVFYQMLTPANSGISREAVLETPPRGLSLTSEEKITPYSVYTADIRAEGSYKMKISGIQMFEGELTGLPIDLIPLPGGITDPDSQSTVFINIPKHALREKPSNAASPDVPFPSVNIGRGVYIPETVTVHLGAPDDESAPNVNVPFSDYIKNVASSEVYPTWPKNSLEANIIAQISLTLNRIYTEWYRSRGYDFDITSLTSYDQAYVYGRNIFEEMSDIVDEIFNRYLSRPNSIEPLFASYCDGVTTTCAGLSQWGSVALAESGKSGEEILGFYYGDVIIEETNDISAPTESYPGSPLSSGESGEDVRILQEQLNRIAVNFPQLPLNPVSGTYDLQTVESVSEFQRLFILPVTGVTDRATWYRVSQIYASVKRLAELTSEGQRAAYNRQEYPGTPIKLNSRGSEVQEIQFYLQRISRFNPTVESPSLDGIFGRGTERAVKSFQQAYGIPETGIVDEETWNRLAEIYNGTLENVDEPNNYIPPVPYPGYVISAGQKGEYVKYIQELLNISGNVFTIIPKLEEDGIFGTETEQSVNAFAMLFSLLQNGSVDEKLWNKLNLISETVKRECIFATDESEGVIAYPGSELSKGSRGDDVVYIQDRINRINAAIPYIPSLEKDGIFGPLTEKSVKRLQEVFGLPETGKADRDTWTLANYVSAAAENGCLPTDKTETAAFAESAGEDEIGSEIKIYEMKELMRANGINAGNGPLFGLKSRRELAKWQKENGLECTGLPDESTRKMLKNAQNK